MNKRQRLIVGAILLAVALGIATFYVTTDTGHLGRFGIPRD